MKLESNRNGVMTILLSIITGGIYMWYIYYCFIEDTNKACKGDGRADDNFFVVLGLSIITCGIYMFFWVYKWAQRCNEYLIREGKESPITADKTIIFMLLGCITCGITSLIAQIKMIDLQNYVNETYNQKNNL